MTEDPLLDRLNAGTDSLFETVLGTLYEHSPWIARRAAAGRPFESRAALASALRQIVTDAGDAAQLALIQAHPDLAGRLARSGTLEVHSIGEQKGLGLDRLSDDEYERFDRLNTAYRARYGFPFIVAVRAHTRASVIAAFEQRLGHTPEQEVRAALNEIHKIAGFRLQDLA